jgi:hypothetical protein
LFGLVYGVGTIGSRDLNVTLGLGYGFYSGGWAKNPTVNVSFMARLSPKTYFISENYIITIQDESPLVILSIGGRSLARRIGIDYGLVIPFYSDMDIFIAVPWIGITVPFHNAGKERQLIQDGF